MTNIHGFMDLKSIKCKKLHRNLNPQQLENIAVEKEGGVIALNGALSINTGKYTGRSPKDRFIVDEESIQKILME